MCEGCGNKTWKCFFVACAELSETLDRLDSQIKRSEDEEDKLRHRFA